MDYHTLLEKIDEARKDLSNAVSEAEIHYFSMQLLMLEEKLESTINKGRE